MLNWTQNRLNATFEGKAGEFDRHLALVLNKLEG